MTFQWALPLANDSGGKSSNCKIWTRYILHLIHECRYDDAIDMMLRELITVSCSHVKDNRFQSLWGSFFSIKSLGMIYKKRFDFLSPYISCSLNLCYVSPFPNKYYISVFISLIFSNHLRTEVINLGNKVVDYFKHFGRLLRRNVYCRREINMLIANVK